ncbi:MAG TPA: polymer-forming cytoskeletal protein [Rhizomicrobium sp.]|jgi:cytoskeletal protein CcmA (bactofilin family)
MTMFTRSDKEPVPAAKPVATPSPAAPQAAPAPIEARRVHAAPGQTSSVSVISKALKITGQLESTEDVHIEGEIDGDVRAASVKVGGNARVKGTVYGEEVELSGKVEGKIEARKVVLTSTAHMSGDVIHQDLRIESGAHIDGHCRPEFGKPDGRAHAVQKPPMSATATPLKPN